MLEQLVLDDRDHVSTTPRRAPPGAEPSTGTAPPLSCSSPLGATPASWTACCSGVTARSSSRPRLGDNHERAGRARARTWSDVGENSRATEDYCVYSAGSAPRTLRTIWEPSAVTTYFYFFVHAVRWEVGGWLVCEADFGAACHILRLCSGNPLAPLAVYRIFSYSLMYVQPMGYEPTKPVHPILTPALLGVSACAEGDNQHFGFSYSFHPLLEVGHEGRSNKKNFWGCLQDTNIPGIKFIFTR